MKKTERLDNETLLVTEGELKYIQFDGLLEFDDRVNHCMTTRIGGTSAGECSTLNLGFNRNDKRENVIENYNRICRSLDIDTGSLVFSNQVHDRKIAFVGAGDRGKGFSRESDILGADGLATSDPGTTLVTFYADCIPVLLYDRAGNRIASIHSGWKSTLKRITAEGVEQLQKKFETCPEDLICVIGPGIGSCCFEVDPDVYGSFLEVFPYKGYYTLMENGKCKIDLKEIIKDTAISAGVKEINVRTSSICTKCRNDLFFSFRGDLRKTGSLAVLMQLREVREGII